PRGAHRMAQAADVASAAPASRALRGPPRPARAKGRHIERAHAMGRLHGKRIDPAVVAPRARRAGARRLRRRPRGGTPRRDEPLASLLDAPRAPLSRLARGARAPRALCPNAAHPERKTMRFLHTMLRVGDLQRSVKFYTEVLGMKLL